MHQPEDLDSSVFAQHHTLGPKATQAAAGNHKHLDLQVLIDAAEARLDALEVEKPIKKLSAGAGQAIGAAGWVGVALATAAAPHTRGNIGAASSSIVINVEGWYIVTGGVRQATHVAARCIMGIGRNNGSRGAVGTGHFITDEDYANNTVVGLSGSEIIYLNVNDYIYLDTWSSTATSLSSLNWLSAAML